MRKRLAAILAVGAFGVAMALPAGASAASAKDACEADGGTYTKVNGENICTYPVGNSDNTKVTEQKGSWNSDGGHDESYTNPNGNQPPGKQGGDTLP